jgi:hypothetical protein
MTVPLEICTTRRFRYGDGYRCRDRHNGGVDDLDALRAYQQAFGA